MSISNYEQYVDAITLERRLQRALNPHGIFGGYLPLSGKYSFWDDHSPYEKQFTYDEVRKVLMGAGAPDDEHKRLLEFFWGTLPQQDTTANNLPRGTAAPETCYHHWVSYFGLNEQFEYCEHCDTKRYPPKD